MAFTPTSSVVNLVLLITLVLIPTATLGQTITCKVSTNFSCEAAGCAPAHLGTWRVIDLSKKTYSRCDLRGCDEYDAQFALSGEFVVIDVPGRGLTAKLAADRTTFLEVVTFGSMALVSFGSCEPTAR